MTTTQTQQRPKLPDGIVGIAEVSERCHVSIGAVSNWVKRAPKDTPWPDPIMRLRMGPLYWWPEVLAWLQATNRESYLDPDGARRLNRFDGPEESVNVATRRG